MKFQDIVKHSETLEECFKVTSDIYFCFQRISTDFNPLHTDVSYAKSMGFNGKVMYGNILNAFVSHFVGMGLPSRDVIITKQDIQYHKPVYIGDEILLKSTIDSISEAVKIISYKLKFYRVSQTNNILVASGHVQIRTLK